MTRSSCSLADWRKFQKSLCELKLFKTMWHWFSIRGFLKRYAINVHLIIQEWIRASCFIADDALKSVECENNLIMFKAIAHLQVSFI